MAKKRNTTKSWLIPQEELEEAAKSSIEKTNLPKETPKKEKSKPKAVSVKKKNSVRAAAPKKTAPPKVKQKPGPKGTGETLKICRLTTSAHKLARRMAFETEETLTEYLSRLVKEDYNENYGK